MNAKLKVFKVKGKGLFFSLTKNDLKRSSGLLPLIITLSSCHIVL